MTISRFEDLDAWRRARDLTVEVYQVSSNGPFARDFGLRNQIQRASVSIMSNIAEGFDRYSRKEFAQFLAIAKGSAAEVRSQLYVAHALGYISAPDHERLYRDCVDVSRVVARLRSSILRT